MGLSRSQNIIVAVAILIMMLVLIFMVFEDLILRVIFSVLAFAAMLRVVYQVLMPPEDRVVEEKNGSRKEKMDGERRGSGRVTSLTITVKGDKDEGD